MHCFAILFISFLLFLGALGCWLFAGTLRVILQLRKLENKYKELEVSLSESINTISENTAQNKHTVVKYETNLNSWIAENNRKD